MKRFLIIIISLMSFIVLSSQTIRTIHIDIDSDIESILGDDRYIIDSLIITGRISHEHFKVLNECCLNGLLSGIDMSCCLIEDGIIPNRAFCDWFSTNRFSTRLKYFRFPYNTERIGIGAFEGTGLKTIEFPPVLKKIDAAAFRNCRWITGVVTLPYGIERIEHTTFQLCEQITHVHLPSTVTYIGVQAFASMLNIKRFILPENLEIIMPYAFENLPLLETITIPPSVKSIHWQAFNECEKLKSIYVNNIAPPYFKTSDEMTRGDNTAMGIPATTILYVPIGTKDMYASTKYWQDFADIKETTNLYPERMVVENREWRYKTIIGNAQDTLTDDYDFSISIGSDTIFNGIFCNKVFYSDNASQLHIGYIYETQDRKVFMYNTLKIKDAYFMHDGWRMVHNYGFNINDDASYIDIDGNNIKARISKIWEIIVSGAKYKCWEIAYDSKYPAYIDVDGIGSIEFGVYGHTSHRKNGFPQYRFISCYDRDICIFNINDYYSENTPTKIGHNNFHKPLHASSIFNIKGHKVKSTKKGLYIKDGKKMMVK